MQKTTTKIMSEHSHWELVDKELNIDMEKALILFTVHETPLLSEVKSHNYFSTFRITGWLLAYKQISREERTFYQLCQLHGRAAPLLGAVQDHHLETSPWNSQHLKPLPDWSDTDISHRMRGSKIDLLGRVYGDEEKACRICMEQFQYTHFETFPIMNHSTWAAPRYHDIIKQDFKAHQ